MKMMNEVFIIITILCCNYCILALELSANVATYAVINKSVVFKVNLSYFEASLAKDFQSARQIIWMDNSASTILTYNRETLKLLSEKNYNDRVKFDRSKLDLTLDKVQDSDVGTWKVFLQNTNAASILYIIVYELSVLHEVTISVEQTSNYSFTCQSLYKVKNARLAPNLKLVTNSYLVSSIVKRETVSTVAKSSVWILDFLNGLSQDLVVHCALTTPSSLSDNFIVGNYKELNSKNLIINAPVNESMQKAFNFTVKHYSVSLNDSLRLVCSSDHSNLTYFWYNRSFEDYRELTRNTDKPTRVSNRNYFDLDSIRNDTNYTCMYTETVNNKVQIHVIRVQIPQSVSLQSKDITAVKCKHCLGLTLALSFGLVIITTIIVFLVIKHKQQKNSGNDRESVPTNYQFYEDLQRQFETQTSAKQFQISGNELKIDIS